MTVDAEAALHQAFDDLEHSLLGGTPVQSSLEELSDRSPFLFAAMFVAVAEARLGVFPQLQDISRLAARILEASRLQGINQRQVEAILRTPLGEPDTNAGTVAPEVYVEVMVNFLALTMTRDDMNDAYFAELRRVTVAHALKALTINESLHDETVVDQLIAATAEPASGHVQLPSFSYLQQQAWPLGLAPPRTVAGAWIKALALRRPEAELRRRTHWRSGELSFLKATFEIAIRGYLANATDLRVTTRFAREMIDLFPAHTPQVLECEAVTRAALGDDSASLEGISGRDRFLVYSQGIGMVVMFIDAPPAAVDGLVVEGEEAAIELGWEPVFLG